MCDQPSMPVRTIGAKSLNPTKCANIATAIATILLLAACGRGSHNVPAIVQAVPTQHPSSSLPSVVVQTEVDSAQPATVATTAALNIPAHPIRSEDGLTYTIFDVEHHDVDLVTYVEAATRELSRDSRIHVIQTQVDTGLTSAGRPIGVIDFTSDASSAQDTLDAFRPASHGYVGRQYILIAPASLTATVVTCLVAGSEILPCDQLLRDKTAELELP